MNTKTSNLKKALYIIIPLILFAIVVIKLKNNKEITQKKVYQYDKEEAINVEADTLHLTLVNAELQHPGTFEPNRETKISAEINGKINTVLIDVGNTVNKGQALIQLDNSLLKLQLETIDVQIEGLKADVNRYTILVEADAIQGVQLEKSILALKSAEIQKATIKEQINKTTIRAPFNGVVTAKLSEEGAYAAPGIPLLQLTDIATLKFTVNVAENDLNQFKINQVYSISADAYPELSLLGKATMVGSKANMGSSFPVQFSINNTSDLKIKSGMFGEVKLSNTMNEEGILIPSSAIIGSENQAQVYLIKNGKAVLQNIVISKKIQNKSLVASGLKTGDVMITSGFINLFEGANVITN